jgi:hypothetical protein
MLSTTLVVNQLQAKEETAVRLQETTPHFQHSEGRPRLTLAMPGLVKILNFFEILTVFVVAYHRGVHS